METFKPEPPQQYLRRTSPVMIKTSIFYSALYAVIALSSGCGKTCEEATYYFDMTDHFYPELDSIKMGDTLWVTSSHFTAFTDTVTNRNIDYSGSSLGLNIELLALNGGDATNPGVTGAFPSFTTTVVEGSEVGNDNLPDQNKGANFKQINDSFILKMAFIPKEKGVYSIGLNNAAAVRRHNGCELAYTNIVNTNQDTHLHYYQDSRPGYVISDYEHTHIYCFKVY